MLKSHDLHLRPLNWELSSAGSEHLPYKQRVGGSIPSAPTPRLVVIVPHSYPESCRHCCSSNLFF